MIPLHHETVVFMDNTQFEQTIENSSKVRLKCVL